MVLFLNSVHGQGLESGTDDRALENRLNARLEGEMHVDGRDLVHTITQISARLAVPFGLEVIKNQEMLVPFSRTWFNATVRQVIDDVVGAYPAYSAQYGDGVIEIKPARAVFAGKGTSILDMHIEAFTVRTRSLRASAGDFID